MPFPPPHPSPSSAPQRPRRTPPRSSVEVTCAALKRQGEPKPSRPSPTATPGAAARATLPTEKPPRGCPQPRVPPQLPPHTGDTSNRRAIQTSAPLPAPAHLRARRGCDGQWARSSAASIISSRACVEPRTEGRGGGTSALSWAILSMRGLPGGGACAVVTESVRRWGRAGGCARRCLP